MALADLFALDAAMGDVVRTTSEEMVGAIRLAWWRERLEELDHGAPPAEPHLEAAKAIIERYGLTGADLAGLATGWQSLLEPFPWGPRVTDAVAAHGRTLFTIAARILGSDGEAAGQAGALWALVDVAKHCTDPGSRDALLAAARGASDALSGKADEAVRPLTMLGLLARRDLDHWPEAEAQGAPGRAWLMVRHRLTGTL